MKLRDAIFVCLVSLAVFGPGMTVCVQQVGGISLPSWLTAEDARWLSGDLGSANALECLSMEGYFSGDLQQSLEEAIGDSIPCKAAALLSTAFMQRTAISASNILFGWECYPTFYGSSYVCLPAEERLALIPVKCNSVLAAQVQRVACAIDELDADIDAEIFIFLVPTSDTVGGSPAERLVSNSLTYSKIEELMSGFENYEWINADTQFAEFCKYWYRTDHHWNYEGFYRGYLKATESMGIDDPVRPIGSVLLDRPWFYGSMARVGLCDVWHDEIGDYLFDLPSYEIYFGNEKVDDETLLNSLKSYEEGNWEDNRFANHYSGLYHDDFSLFELKNASCSNEKSLLIVGDSFTNSIERLFASHYQTVYCMDIRWSDVTVRDFLSDHPEIKQVLFLAGRKALFSEEALALLQDV